MNNCPKCTNGKLVASIDGSSMITTCDSCGWSVATSYIEPIFLDENIYGLFLEDSAGIDGKALAAVSKVAGCNYIEAKKLLDNSGKRIIEGNAVEIRAAAAELKRANVPFEIIPEFPHEI